METRWIADWNITVDSFIAVEAFAKLGTTAQTISTVITQAEIAYFPLPAFLAKADVRVNTSSVHALRPAYRHTAIDSCPAFETLAALAVILVIVEETLLEVIEASRCDV